MKKTVFSLAMLAGFLMGSVTLFAHHGTGISYDLHKTVVVKGVIVRFAYANPHSQLYFDVTDDQGKVVHWSAEMRNPLVLETFGHSKRELTQKFAAGTELTVTGSPSKAGTPVMVFGKAVLADGWCLCNHEGGPGSDAPGVAGGERGDEAK
jgi:hypothetical protein